MRQVLSSQSTFFSTTAHRQIANLVELELPSQEGNTKLYCTDFSTDITFNGNLYKSGQLKSISSYTQNTKLTSAQINVVVTGLDTIQLSLFLQDGHSLQGKKVTIHQAYIDRTGQIVPIMDGNKPFIWFKGLIQGGSIQDKREESLGESSITWTCTNDFYDFERVSGRFTNDASHRQLITNNQGVLVPSGAAKRPEYSNDLGFFHADKSTQILAKYQQQEKRYKVKSSKKGGLSGLIGGKNIDLVEYYETVERSVDLSFNLAAKYLPVVYGTQFVGGIPIFADTDKNNPNNVWVVYQVCEGEIEGFLDIHIDDKPLICIDDNDDEGRVCFGRKRVNGDTMNVLAVDSSGNPVPGASGPSVHGQSYILKDDDSEIQFWVYHGLKNQTASSVLVNKAQNQEFYLQSLDNIGPEYWDQNFMLLDTQYVVMKVSITEQRNNIPDVMFEVKGRKTTTYGSNLVPVTGKTSSNLAWQILDYATAIFGQTIPLDSIDLTSFYECAAQYDTIDTSYDATWVPFWRYLNWSDTSQNNRKVIQTNWSLDTANSVFDCFNLLLTQGQASLSTFNGKYYLTQEIDRQPVQSIILDETIGGNIKITDSTGRTKFNTVGAGISDPANMWNQIQVSFYDASFLQKDSMREKKLSLTFPGITNYYTARSMAARELKKSRYSRTLDGIKPDSDLFYLLPNDPVTLTYGRYSYTNKTFFVESITTDSRGRIDLTLTEYSSDVFINSPQSDNSNNQVPGISSNILPPRNLQYFPHISIGSDQIGLNGTLKWLPSLSTGVLYYTIHQSGRTDPYTVEQTPDMQTIELPLVNLPEGNYTFEVRQVIGSGLRSKPQVLVTNINPAKSLNPITNFRALNRVPGEQQVFQGGYIDLQWDRTPDENYVQPLYYVIEFYNATNTLVRSLRLTSLYSFTYLLTDMKQDYRLATGQTGVYRKYRIRIRAEGSKGEQSVSWVELQ